MHHSTSDIKKKNSLRSLLSIFTGKPRRDHEKPGFPVNISCSTNSLPSHQGIDRSDTTYVDVASTDSSVSLTGQICPPFSHSPPNSSSSSSSSSSTTSESSLDLPSETSTAATTPFNSSPSVVMKPVDLPSSPSMVSLQSESAQLSKNTKRTGAFDNYRNRPSPLSNVTCAPYALPSPPASPVLHERRNSFQPKRRNTIGRLLRRGHESSPELNQLFDDEECDEVPLPRMPMIRPSSAGGVPIARQRSLRMGISGRADLEKPTSYSSQERMEHRSILGADPAGLGFYLYPRAPQPQPQPHSQKYSTGVSSEGRVGGHARRLPKGRNFRRNVNTTSIIFEEEGYELAPQTKNNVNNVQNQRRYSEVPVHTGQWRQPRHADAPSTSINNWLHGGTVDPARRTLHNNWNHTANQGQFTSSGVSSKSIPRRDPIIPESDEMVLRRLQMRSVCKSDPVEYGQDSMTECGTHDRMVGVEMIMV